MEQDERKYRATAGTTQAIDLIGGGVKVCLLAGSSGSYEVESAESIWLIIGERTARTSVGRRRP